MNYWRMQLHPSESEKATAHTIRSLGLGYIGLDFANPPGDLTDVSSGELESGHQDYWDFAHKMEVGDIVLIIAHHYPFALVKVTSKYNYIRSPLDELGVWFRHFRRVETISYYGDFETHPAKWQKTIMTDTISVLNDNAGVSYQLIEKWLRSVIA